MPVIDTHLLTPIPWKNGTGATRTLAVSPDSAGFDDFIWRVSIAEVRQSGNFSVFPGVDRTIILLDGRGMMLYNNDGSIHALTTPFQPWSMRGDDPVRARLLNGSARDFNVMVRRGRARADVRVWQSESTLPSAGSDAVFFCPRGVFRVSMEDGEHAQLAAGCALRASSVRPSGVQLAPEAPDSILIGALLNRTDHLLE